MTQREWALKVLGLGDDATDQDIKVAYRDLISVWHPDKHIHNERVRERAEQMVKRLNEARDILFGIHGAGSWSDDEFTDEPPPPDQPAAPKETSAKAVSRKRPKTASILVWLLAIVASATLLIFAFVPLSSNTIWIWDSRFWSAPQGSIVAPVTAPKHAQESEQRAPPVDSNRTILGKLGQAIKETAITASPGGRVYYRLKPYEYLVLRTSDRPNTYKVLLENGTDGYVNSEAVAKLPYDVTAPKDSSHPSNSGLWSSSLGDQVAKSAVGRIGDQGAELADGGLVASIWEPFGVTLPPSAAEQVDFGKPVKKLEDLERGDRLYFWDAKKGKIGSAGIYVGKGYMVWFDNRSRTIAMEYLGSQKLLNQLCSARR